MRVHSFNTAGPALLPACTRLSARLDYDGNAPSEDLWFEVPEALGPELSVTGDPWLACLMPLAMTLREPLRIERPVDPVLCRNLKEQAMVWRAWYPHLGQLHVEAGVLAPTDVPAPSRVAAFFSGGVDSFFTALRPRRADQDGPAIQDLVHVFGFDLTLDRRSEYRRVREYLAEAAASLGKTAIFLATNLRETRINGSVDWGAFFHGGALASAALLLERRWRHVYLASSHSYCDLEPWGTHPLTDPLFSTSTLRFAHDGAGFKRTQKTAAIAHAPEAQRHLHVCWRSNADHNCSRCAKCYRTMVTLDLLGALEQFGTFDRARYDRRLLGRLYTPGDSDRSFLREVAELAVERGQPEVARAMCQSIRRSRCLRPLLEGLKRLHPRRGRTRLDQVNRLLRSIMLD